MRALKHHRFGKFWGWVRSLNRKRFTKIREIQKRLSMISAATNCVICNTDDFELVSESDRFGLIFNKQICTGCGLLQTNPMPPKEFFNIFYEMDYRELYRGDRKTDLPKILEIQRSRSGDFIKFIQANCDLDNFQIFEIGCSYGGNLDTFKEYGCHVSGCDIDTYAVSIAKERHKNVFVAELPDAGSSTPTIYILSHVLEHIPDPIRFLDKVYKLMTETDLLFIEVPGIEALKTGAYRGNLLNYFHIGHVLEFNEQTLVNSLGVAKFKAIASDEICRGIFQKSDAISPQFENAYQITKKQILYIENKFLKSL